MSDMSSNEKDEDVQRLQTHINQLAEHYDAVQIFVSRNDATRDVTHGHNRGTGNWWTRYGQITEWIKYEDERIRVQCRKNEEEST